MLIKLMTKGLEKKLSVNSCILQVVFPYCNVYPD